MKNGFDFAIVIPYNLPCLNGYSYMSSNIYLIILVICVPFYWILIIFITRRSFGSVVQLYSSLAFWTSAISHFSSLLLSVHFLSEINTIYPFLRYPILLLRLWIVPHTLTNFAMCMPSYTFTGLKEI